MIAQWRGKDSLVIGLFGAWGSGKTSLTNLIVECLRSDSKIEVVQFNPWQWSGHEELTTAYFRDLQAQLGQKNKSKAAKKVAAQLKAYGAFLGATREVMLGIPLAAQFGFVIAIMVGLSPTWFSGAAAHSEMIGFLSLGAIAIIGLLSTGQRLVDTLAKWKEFRADADTKGLADIKQDLSSSLRSFDRTLLVVIDDIDRLTRHQIREIFQLVKANADFPNFVYLLPFQRSAAVALKDVHDESGDAFLEKIIQIPIDVPVIRKSAVEIIFTEKLDAIFAQEMTSELFSKERWLNVFHGGLQHYLPDLRAVGRLSASLAFHAGLFRREGQLDVNAVDLIALETLRVFEPRLFERMSKSKSLMTTIGRKDGRSGELAQIQIDALVELVAESNRTGVKELLRELFPNIEWALGGTIYGPDFHEGWLKEIRVCCSEVFDRYFELQLNSQEISQAELQEVLESAGDPERLDALVQAFRDSNRLPSFLSLFEPRIDEIKLANIVNVVPQLCSLADHLPEAEIGMFSVPPSLTVGRIIRRLLFREPSLVMRVDALSAALSRATGVGTVVTVIASEARRQSQATGEAKLVEPWQLEDLKILCVIRIRELAAAGSLIHEKDLVHTLFRWKEWGSEEEVRSWVSRMVEVDETLVQLLAAFVQRSTSTGFGDRFSRVTWFIKLSDLEQFASSTRIKERLALLEVKPEDIELARAIFAFEQAMEHRATGKPESDFGPDT